MKKLMLTIGVMILLVTSTAMGSDWVNPYDPSAARKDFSNVTPAVGLSALGLDLRLDTINASFTGDIDVTGDVGAATIHTTDEVLIATSTDAGNYTLQVGGDQYNSGNIYMGSSATGIVQNAGILNFRTGSTYPVQIASDGTIGIGMTPSLSIYKVRLAGTATHTVPLFISPSNPIVTTNDTKYATAIQTSKHTPSIATDVVDSGYRRGITLDSYIDTANFHGTLATLCGMYVSSGIFSGDGTITNNYGIYLKNYRITGVISNDWGIYQADAAPRNYYAGRTLMGSNTDNGSSILQVTGGASFSADIDVGGNIGLAAIATPTTPVAGTIFYSSGNNGFYGYNGSEWKRLDN